MWILEEMMKMMVKYRLSNDIWTAVQNLQPQEDYWPEMHEKITSQEDYFQFCDWWALVNDFSRAIDLKKWWYLYGEVFENLGIDEDMVDKF